MTEKWFPVIVKAFEEFSLFCKTKSKAAIMGVFFISLLGGLFLLLYFGYKKIESLGVEMKKSVEILERTHSTPESLQEGLTLSVNQNLIIEKELTRIMNNSKNGVSAMFFKFHDSKTDLQGKHDFFYSAMNEVTRSDSYSFMGGLQNVPITGMAAYMVPMIENKCQTVKTSEIVGNSWLKSKFEQTDITRVSACPIYDVTDRYLLGFVELVYVEGKDQVRTPEEVESCLKLSAQRLSSVITNVPL